MVSKDVYAEKAISQIPRLLSMEDRNPCSPSYGCFWRDYWLDKTLDFPSALAQFAVHSLALVYAYQFPNNIYYQQPKIRDWCIAGIDYWTKLQHKDGSFDEFYPFERGWAGPTAFTLYAALSSYEILKDEFPKDVEDKLFVTAHRAAKYLAKYDEVSVLANHHAIAALGVRKAYDILGENELLKGVEDKIQGFLEYHTEEGWSFEYGGADPGYLSATVSFFGKLYQIQPTEELLNILKSAVEFASYFVYPNKFYAGTIGSRQTLHFYPHGFEILSHDIPLAGAMAEKMLEGLSEGKLVSPEIMTDRYLCYRVPEFLLAYLDYKPRLDDLPQLPFERPPFTKHFSKANIFVKKEKDFYALVNLQKGGVTKVFSLRDNKLIYNDCGIVGVTKDGNVLTSQWIENDYQYDIKDDEITVEGHLNKVPSKYFTPLKTIVFRTVLILVGWSTKLCYHLKGGIRKLLVVGKRLCPVRFKRNIKFEVTAIVVTDEIKLEKKIRFKSLFIGDEFSVRFVPQSLYFQSQELDISGIQLQEEELKELHERSELCLERRIDLTSGKVSTSST